MVVIKTIFHLEPKSFAHISAAMPSPQGQVGEPTATTSNRSSNEHYAEPLPPYSREEQGSIVNRTQGELFIDM
jgi:hypothetical protein